MRIKADPIKNMLALQTLGYAGLRFPKQNKIIPLNNLLLKIDQPLPRRRTPLGRIQILPADPEGIHPKPNHKHIRGSVQRQRHGVLLEETERERG